MMNTRHYLLLALLLIAGCTTEDLMSSPTSAPNLPTTTGTLQAQGGMVDYYNGVQGYYARPANENSYPGVVMIHEWGGLNNNMKAMADQLAAQGYQVLAVDLYNGTVATSAAEARNLTG